LKRLIQTVGEERRRETKGKKVKRKTEKKRCGPAAARFIANPTNRLANYQLVLGYRLLAGITYYSFLLPKKSTF